MLNHNAILRPAFAPADLAMKVKNATGVVTAITVIRNVEDAVAIQLVQSKVPAIH